MPWFGWITPSPIVCTVRGWATFPGPNTTLVVNKLPVDSTRQAGGRIHVDSGLITAVGNLVTNFPSPTALDTVWGQCQAGAILLSANAGAGPSSGGDVGYGLGGSVIAVAPPTNISRYSGTMAQNWYVQDFTDIATYRPERPDEFDSLGLIENIDFYRAPDLSYIRFDPSQSAELVGYKIRTGTRPVDPPLGTLEQTTVVNGLVDGSLPTDGTAPGWVTPGGGGAVSYDAFSAGVHDVDWTGVFSGFRISLRFFAASTEGARPGFNHDLLFPAPGTRSDNEFHSGSISDGFAVLQYPRFAVWAPDGVPLRWLHHLSPWVIWNWLHSSAWLTVRASVTQTYY